MPDNNPRPFSIALLATPEATASTLFGLYDLFKSVHRDWHLLQHGEPGASLFEPLIVSRRAGPLSIANGVTVHADAAIGDMQLPGILCLPDVFVAPREPVAGRFDEEIAWIRHCHRSGVIVAAACSGALLLAEAGLLDGLDATTHWGYCDALQESYPSIRVHPRRALVATGPGQRLVMAGGGTSWQDLALYLIARTAGLKHAMQVARVYLIDWHHRGQQPFALLNRRSQVDDPVIGRCQEWIAGHYDTPSPVAAMAKLSGLGERSFKRRFRKATGLTPLQYVHTLRLEEAKQLLESGDLPVEAVAEEVGYEDSSFFCRLFRREVGLTAAQYRRRFGALRRALHDNPESAVPGVPAGAGAVPPS